MPDWISSTFVYSSPCECRLIYNLLRTTLSSKTGYQKKWYMQVVLRYRCTFAIFWPFLVLDFSKVKFSLLSLMQSLMPWPHTPLAWLENTHAHTRIYIYIYIYIYIIYYIYIYIYACVCVCVRYMQYIYCMCRKSSGSGFFFALIPDNRIYIATIHIHL